MRTRLALLSVIASSAVVLGPGTRPAPASSLVFRCGAGLANVCRADPAHPGRVTHLTRDGSPRRHRPSYTWLSASRDGRRLAFNFDNDLYVADGRARHKRKIEPSIFTTFVRPDGRQIAFTQSQLVPIPCPTFNCGSTFVPYLYTINPNGTSRNAVAGSTTTVGWLGSRLMREDDPEGGGPQFICVLKSNADRPCGRTVARDPLRDVYDPVGTPDGRYVVATVAPHQSDSSKASKLTGRIGLFATANGQLVRDLTRGPSDDLPTVSPDGKQVAFSRGSSVYVVRTNGRDGGRARRLLSGAGQPVWTR